MQKITIINQVVWQTKYLSLKREIFKSLDPFTHSGEFIDYLQYNNNQAERCTNSQSVLQGLIIY